MKDVAEVRALVSSRIDQRLAELVAAPAAEAWPWRLPLGRPTGTDLQTRWEALRTTSLEWRRLTEVPGVTVTWTDRLVASIRQSIPVTIELDTIDAAAAFSSPSRARALAVARRRWSSMTERFPDTSAPDLLRVVLRWSDVDFNLCLDAATWFRSHPAVDNTWTARMVPVPGLHAKWLDGTGRRRLVARLAGLDQIRTRERPAQAHVTYLDPDWREAGGRRFDVMTVGDVHTLPYSPRVVLVSENRDTALYFPPVPRGIAIRGDGDRALRFLPQLAPDLPQIIYWGDLDADGLEIVHELRERAVPVQTILMDRPTYDTYEQFGTHVDRAGKPLGCPQRRTLPLLTSAESELYDLLTDPKWTGPRRVEQERIPLPVAARVLSALVG